MDVVRLMPRFGFDAGFAFGYPRARARPAGQCGCAAARIAADYAETLT